MDNLLKNRISKGEKAYYASEYILPLLKTYEKEILLSLEKGENIRKLHGMAYIIKKINDTLYIIFFRFRLKWLTVNSVIFI